VRKDTTIIHYRDSLRLRVINIQPSPEPERYDSVRTYMGSDPHLYGRINWTAKTGGYLHELKINPVLDIPIQTITHTIEKEKTVVIRPKGIYAMGGINSQFSPHLGAAYLHDRSMINYTYTPSQNLHQIGVGFRLF
jgi:hypothetical protein